MNITASGRSAQILATGLLLATGLWIGFAGPSMAASDPAASSKSDLRTNAAASSTGITSSAKHVSRHLKKYAHQKSGKVADKSTEKKADDPAPEDASNSPAVPSSTMPVTVANANAQLPASDTPAANAQAMSDRANTILQAPLGNQAAPDAQPMTSAPVVAADQLNEVDRALHSAAPPTTPVTLASADAPRVTASPPSAAAANSSDNSTWDQTSLIGKIFIGFGALLTMASAARMFMA